PVTDNIEKLAKILLRHVGLAQQNGLEIVHIDEGSFFSVYSRGEIIINIDRLGVISVTPSLFFVVIHVIRCYTESKDFKKG
ncbi:MAG: hypothetical protein U0K87_06235, partial [Ruminococcus sp.]|nr:hypothetical protein [Ruminococcus sp.]